jgi:hypothetical protein
MKTLLQLVCLLAIGISCASPGRAATATNPPPRLTVELRDGSRVVGASADDYFTFRSALLGEVKLNVKDIRTVECVSSNSAKLSTASGDSLMVSFVDSEFAVNTSFGKVDLSVDSIRSVKVSLAAQSAAGPIFNIDFGPGRSAPTKQVGPAAVGNDGDFWNSIAIGFNNDHTESSLKFADGEPSPIAVELINLGGGWGNEGKMGIKTPMLDSFNYPVNNQGGNSRVILYHVPPGTYALYLYGHGIQPLYYGDYAVSVAGRDYGRKQTTTGTDAVENTDWVEGSQYVRFPALAVVAGENIEILIRPGGQITDHLGRIVSDAMICGLQLVPTH